MVENLLCITSLAGPSKVYTLVTNGQVIVEVRLPSWRQYVGCGKVDDCQGKDCNACQATRHTPDLSCQDEKGYNNNKLLDSPMFASAQHDGF